MLEHTVPDGAFTEMSGRVGGVRGEEEFPGERETRKSVLVRANMMCPCYVLAFSRALGLIG